MDTQAGADNHRVRTGRRFRVSALAIVTVLASLGAATVAGVTPAAAATIDGQATIYTPSSGAVTYPAASTQLFTIAPPSGATCTGNTASNGTKVFTYLVPSGTNVQNLAIQGGYVESPSLAIFDYTTSPIENIDIPSNNVIPTFPNDLEWGPAVTQDSLLSTLLDSDGGTTGTWEAGFACATGTGQITDYWNTQITFTANGSDPNGFVWTAVPGDPNGGAAPEVPYAIVLPLLAFAIVGGTILIRRRRRSPAQVA